MRALLILGLCATAYGAKTRILDVMRNTAGTPENAMCVISWPTFTAYDSTVMSAAQITLKVNDGIVDVSLEPTQGASPSVTYTVQCRIVGVPTLDNETWSVPVSTNPVTLATVLVSSGGSGGGGGSGGSGGGSGGAGIAQSFPVQANFYQGGSALTAPRTIYVPCPYTGTITAWGIVVDHGTASFTTWSAAGGGAAPTSVNSISISGVSITSGTAVRSTTLTDFTSLAVNRGDIIALTLTAAAGATQAVFTLEVTAPSGGSTYNFSDAEIPSGSINGVNADFTLTYPPSPAPSLKLYLNGLLLQSGGLDYVLSGTAITFAYASIPQTGDVLTAWYRY